MKSIQLYIFLTFMILFSIQYSESSNEKNERKNNVPCESKCLACQQAAYNIKFYQKPNCKKNHCRSTVF
jgi:hypothetical protein